MTDYAVGPSARVSTIRDEDAVLAGLPKQSDFSGPGYYGPRSPTPGSPGWATHVHGLRQHPTQRGRFAYPIAAETKSELAARLPHDVAALVQAAAPLGKDWDPPGLEEAEPNGREART